MSDENKDPSPFKSCEPDDDNFNETSVMSLDELTGKRTD